MSPPSRSELIIVESDKHMPGLLGAVCGAHRIALDTEANSLHRYYHRVCLIQLSIDGQDWIVDPLAKLDLTPLLSALSTRPLIFHSADYDLRMLRQDLSFRPAGEIFDTAIAAQLLGYPQFGLVDLADQLLGVSLCKHGQKSDWSQRPLTPAQLEYARDDTHHLMSLALRLEEQLIERGRLGWHREACERMVRATAQDSAKPERDTWRVKGSTRLEPRELAFLREIWNWREGEAQRTDRPPFKILTTETMIELALWAEREGRPGKRIGVRLPRNCGGGRLERLERALNRAHQMPEADWPERYAHPVRQPLAAQTRRLAEQLTAACSEIAAEHDLPPAVVAPRAMLMAVALHQASTVEDMLACSNLMRWQAELLAPRVAAILR